MKDFFDIWVLLQQFKVTREHVAPIIREVFKRRRTPLKDIPETLSPRFYSDPKTMERWANFLSTIGHQHISLEKIAIELIDFFQPVFAQIQMDDISQMSS